MEHKNPDKTNPAGRKPLRIALLTMNQENYSCRRLIEAAKMRGHVLQPLETFKCEFDFNRSSGSVFYDGVQLPKFDAIIPRIGTRATALGAALVGRFSQLGAYCLNRPEAIIASRDKLLAHQLLSRAKIPILHTIFGSPNSEPDEIIKKAGAPPLVIKLMQGSQGNGVRLAETVDAARKALNLFRELGVDFIVQEYIKEANGSDLRCLVLGNKIVGAMRRQAKLGDFRSNLRQGGTAFAVELTDEEKRTAIEATQHLGLDFAGADILRTCNGSVLLELNASPGLKGIESITGKNIASDIISYVEKRVIARNE